MHRSGTSLCAHLLSGLGIDMTAATGPRPDNAKGHWERAEIVTYHDRILKLLNRAWGSPTHTLSLPAGWWAEPRVRAVRNEMISWLRQQLAERVNFGFKDPRVALMLPVWNEIVAELEVEPVFIYCVRAPAQAARSLASRDNMETSDAEYRWVVYNMRAIAGFGSRPVCIIPYEGWFESRDTTLVRLLRHVALQWTADDPEVQTLTDEIIDPTLRHDAMAPSMGPTARLLHQTLLQSAAASHLSSELRRYASNFMGFEQLIAPMHQELIQLRSLKAQKSKPALAVVNVVPQPAQ
jgi:hypothetical protein